MDMACDKPALSTLEAPPSIAAVRRIGDGFKAFQALRAGYDSGLFDWLERHGPLEKPAIAAALRLRSAHLGGFLQALEDLGLLARQNNAYSLAPGMSEVLCSASPWCQAEALDDLLAPSCGWSDLKGFLSEGWTATARSEPLSLALHPFLGEARRLAAYLAARWDNSSRRLLLFFDGSDGLATSAMCQSQPGLSATVVVLPEAIGRTQALIDACGLSQRCHVIAGTPLDPPAKVTYDRVVLFHSLYPVRKHLADALAAAAACVTPGGELCCAHWFCPEACETAPGGLRDLDKAVLTDSHPLCHVEQFCQRLEEAGLIGAERDDLAGEYGNTKLHFASRARDYTACARERGC